MNTRKNLVDASLLLLGLLCTLSAAHSQEAEPPALYQVEMIIFRHADQSRTTQEIPRPPAQQVEDMLTEELPKATTRTSRTPGTAPPNITVLGGDQLSLAGIRTRLEKLSAYDVLTHRGWIQTAPDVAQAEEIDLSALAVDIQLVQGSASVYKRRYLHLAVDVSLPQQGLQTESTNDSQQLPITIDDSRRMRLGRLSYFDHPEFGIIALITRVKTEES